MFSASFMLSDFKAPNLRGKIFAVISRFSVPQDWTKYQNIHFCDFVFMVSHSWVR